MANQAVLKYLSLEDLNLAMIEWRKLHPRETISNANVPTSERKAHMLELGNVYQGVLREVEAHFSVDAFAELQTVFSIGKDRLPPDELQTRVGLFQRDFKDAPNLARAIGYLYDKSNLQEGICNGLVALGLKSWADDLRAL